MFLQVEQIKADRDSLETELKSATLDIKDKFLQALAADGAIDEPAISVAEIGKALAPYQRRAQASVQEQEQLVAEIQEQHAAFSRENGVGSDSRDALLKQLATSYDVFTELQNNLKEGTKFYNDLTELLVIFQNKISDYCFARKTEKDELLKDLTTASSRAAPPSTPSIPSHHTDISATTNTVPSAPGNVPYPTQIHNMPIPYGASTNAPYPTYMPPPMPQCFNPYATLPYPGAYQFPQGPQGPQGGYGTWPGPQGGYYPPQQPPH